MNHRSEILIVDDEAPFRTHLARFFIRKGYKVAEAASGQEAFALAERKNFDIVLLDIVLPDLDGIEVLKSLRERNIDTQVIMITGNATVGNAVTSMKQGAYDYLTKPFDMDELCILVERACELSNLRRDSILMRRELRRQRGLDQFIGENEKIVAVQALVDKVAPSSLTVLITGETGTGKELIAKAIHRQSPRCHEPFVVVNCSAIQDALLESEMFGHEKGAFTGAIREKSGLIEVAGDGTLFLDEIGDLSPALQTKLLRFLESGEYRRVGSTRGLRADVRVLAATSRDLKKMLQDNRFRAELFYRLNVVNIELPPLRDKPGDIPLLVEHFLRRCCRRLGRPPKSVDAGGLDVLLRYTWPGNVRELENVIERAVILTSGDTITIRELPSDLIDQPPPSMGDSGGEESLASAARDHILHVLRETAGNKTQAARVLKITKKTLYARLRAYGIHH